MEDTNVLKINDDEDPMRSVHINEPIVDPAAVSVIDC